jgi:hypothetical protein
LKSENIREDSRKMDLNINIMVSKMVSNLWFS